MDDFLFFGESETGIKALIAAYKDQKTLEYSTAFKQFAEETLSEKSSLLWIGNAAKLKKEKRYTSILESTGHRKISLCCFQGVVENDFMHLHFRLHYSEKELPKASVTNVGIISLEQPVATAPQWLKNHRTKEKDIAVQDENNTLLFVFQQRYPYRKRNYRVKFKGLFNK